MQAYWIGLIFYVFYYVYLSFSISRSFHFFFAPCFAIVLIYFCLVVQFLFFLYFIQILHIPTDLTTEMSLVSPGCSFPVYSTDSQLQVIYLWDCCLGGKFICSYTPTGRGNMALYQHFLVLAGVRDSTPLNKGLLHVWHEVHPAGGKRARKNTISSHRATTYRCEYQAHSVQRVRHIFMLIALKRPKHQEK